MASTYSTNLALELIGTGEQAGTWGTTTNTNLGTLIEQAISGYGSAVVSTGSTTTITMPNGASGTARNMVITVTGTGGASTVLAVPDSKTKLYVIFNNTSPSTAFTVKTVSGTGISVPGGTKAILYCDGTNVVDAINYLSSLSLGTALPVASGGTGLATLTANNVILGNGTSTPSFVAPGTSGNLLTSDGTTWTSAAAPAGSPTGGLLMWPTATAPSGWLLCAGAAVSRTTYSALFAVVGTTFGVGDGSTTFNLPDYRDRMPIGAGTTYSANSTGGSKDAVVVSHTHTATVTDSGHSHTYTSVNAGGAGGNIASGGGNVSSPSTSTATTGISVSNASTGVSGTNANLPPYLGIYFIIKT
jgi:microcystin-dependent protein